MIVVGGTYTEICFEPIWENIFGSGFRAVTLLLSNNANEQIEYYTSADKTEIEPHLRYYENLYSNLEINIFSINKSPEFHYDHPLRTPAIVPRADVYQKNKITIDRENSNILSFGMLETDSEVHGNKVVYDPQSPVLPRSFKETGSSAKQLAIIVNRSEARILSQKTQINDMRDWLFENENCNVLIIKCGAKGAFLFEHINDIGTHIPVYETKNVWPIGSGDVFSATFANFWFSNNNDVKDCAINASRVTATYCNSKNLDILGKSNEFKLNELKIPFTPKEQVYLAGPFFTMGERWLVNEAWITLKSFGLNVFSPFHDVGHGSANDVVKKDLEGLDGSKIIFAIVDGLDSGTLFEIGYAICQKKKVIAFVQNEGEESLKMLEGTNCIIEKDFTTALYKLYWELGKK